MQKIIPLAVVAAASALSVPAFAADTDFAGPRAELLAGYDIVEGDEGLVYGLAAGYDAAVGRGIIGIETEINDSTVRETYAGVIAPGDELRIGAGRDLYIGARVGFAAAPRTLLYAKAGYSNAAIDVRYDDGNVDKAHPKADGYRIGAGVEQAFGTRSYAKLEYRYSNYGHVDYAGSSIAADIDRHQIVAGFGIRF